MSVSISGPMEGLDVLEKGLKNLRRSRMMTLSEFKDMFGAIERHHRDLKLAHLTGKSKDLMDHAQRDTKFYHILVKMLCEVKDVKAGKQQESLRKVYTWYLGNKHVLYSGPHFGKTHRRQEAQQAIKKVITPRNPPPTRQSHRTSSMSAGDGGKRSESRMTNGHSHDVSLDLTSPRNGQTSTNQENRYSDTEIDLDFLKTAMNDDDGLDENDIADLNGHMDSGREDFRCKTPSVRITPLRELQSSNIPRGQSGLPKKMVHSVASMVNPHAQHSLTLSPDGEKYDRHMQFRPTTAPALREDILESWKNFNTDMTFGQDMISKLNFVGRSGTASDVRYTAHEQGEMPELHTRHYLQGVQVAQQGCGKDANHLLNQTLEEFYQTTDAYYPTNLPKYQSAQRRAKRSVGQKPASAPPVRSTKSRSTPTLGRNFLTYDRQVSEDNPDTQVKVDTVVSIIDTVRDEMTEHKERVAPWPQPGFRQPAATGIPTTPTVSRPATSMAKKSPRMHSPTARTNTPVHSPPSEPRSQSLPADPTKNILMPDLGGVERAESTTPSRAASAIDWRGKITPDTVRYKWGKTKFGGHTYIKNLQRPPSMRSAGATAAGSRPKTAPHPSKQKQKAAKASKGNSRVAQAASHTTVSVDQQSVDNMMIIQHLLGTSDSRRGSLGSLIDFDDEFFQHLRKCSPGSMAGNSPALEYLTFISSTQAAGEAPPGPSGSPARRSEVAGESLTTDTDIGFLTDHLRHSERILNGEIRLPRTGGSVSSGAEVDPQDISELEAELKDLCEEDSQPGEATLSDHDRKRAEVAEEAEITTAVAAEQTEEVADDIPAEQTIPQPQDQEEAQIEVTAVPSTGRKVPSAHVRRESPIQVLTKSNTWHYMPGIQEDEAEVKKQQNLKLKTASARYTVSSEHFTVASFEPDAALGIPASRMTTKVERSAGRMPGQSSSTSAQVLRMSRRQNDLFKRSPPIRTPPSIPTPYNPYGGRSPRGSRVFSKELDSHARKVKSPRHFMEHVRDLRQTSAPRSAPPVMSHTSEDSQLGESLHVCRLPTREKTVIVTSADNGLGDGPTSILKASDNGLAYRDSPDYEKQVKFGTASEFQENGVAEEEDQDEGRGQLGSLADSGRSSSRSSKQGSGPPTPIQRQPLAHIGRPIAHYQSVPDPDELSQAVQIQKEAAAAVDIQRIFRGYVARGAYRRLLSEERWRREDTQREKMESRRKHQEHVSRTQAIYNRGPNSDDVNWQKDYKAVRNQKERERQCKMDTTARENAYNHHSSASTISVIGPHVEIYQVYHPKKTGPSQRELNMFALMIQKHVRGWLVRRRLDKLKRKAVWSGFSFERMVKDYKSMLIRVQKQHGRDRGKTPFTFKEMNEYMDLRRRYESVFEKKAFGGELELCELDQFFKECDLYPSQAELDEAVDVIFKGKGVKGRGLKRREVLDIVFYIYVPKAANLENTRMSTWMNPIIDGVEARRLLGSEFVEEAPLEVCAKLVIASKRERRERENKALQKQREEEERKDEDEDDEEDREKDKKERRKASKADLKAKSVKTLTVEDKEGKLPTE